MVREIALDLTAMDLEYVKEPFAKNGMIDMPQMRKMKDAPTTKQLKTTKLQCSCNTLRANVIRIHSITRYTYREALPLGKNCRLRYAVSK